MTDHTCQVCGVPITFYDDGDCCPACWEAMDDDLEPMDA